MDTYYDALSLLALDPETPLSLKKDNGRTFDQVRHPKCLVLFMKQWPAVRERLNINGAAVVPATGLACSYCEERFK